MAEGPGVCVPLHLPSAEIASSLGLLAKTVGAMPRLLRRQGSSQRQEEESPRYDNHTAFVKPGASALGMIGADAPIHPGQSTRIYFRNKYNQGFVFKFRKEQRLCPWRIK